MFAGQYAVHDLAEYERHQYALVTRAVEESHQSADGVEQVRDSTGLTANPRKLSRAEVGFRAVRDQLANSRGVERNSQREVRFRLRRLPSHDLKLADRPTPTETERVVPVHTFVRVSTYSACWFPSDIGYNERRLCNNDRRRLADAREPNRVVPAPPHVMNAVSAGLTLNFYMPVLLHYLALAFHHFPLSHSLHSVLSLR